MTHPFGIISLPIMACHWALMDKLATPLITRFETAPNGVAILTTAYATLNQCVTEPWYDQFIANNKEEMDLLSATNEVILNHKYSYHQNANYYHQDRLTTVMIGGTKYTMDKMKQRLNNLASIAAGHQRALKSAHDDGYIPKYNLANSKAVHKAAMNNPMMSLRVQNLTTYGMEGLIETTDTKEIMEIVFPQIKAESDSKKEASKETALTVSKTNSTKK
jgi:hypothetical protein